MRSCTRAKNDKTDLSVQVQILYAIESVWTASPSSSSIKTEMFFYNINYLWLTWIKLIISKTRMTWLLSRLISSRDRAKKYKIKMEQITEGIISVTKIPQIIERLSGVSRSILFYSFTWIATNVDDKGFFKVSVR